MPHTPAVGQPDTDAAIERALAELSGRRIAVLTGAGISTDSGIPDYRGEGAPRRTPMTAQKFLSDADARRRYWIGSHLGWRAFTSAVPNRGHEALARLERGGRVPGVITQNVDGLHERAGSTRVVELHGTMSRVRCTHCHRIFDRRDIAERIERDNPWIAVPDAVILGPDGDVAPEADMDFVVPDCPVCGGVLRPDVVFFGEFIPPERFHEAEEILRAGDALLVTGSSLVVNSGIRLVERARRRRIPVVIVNRGATKADARATVKIDGGTSEVLTRIADEFAPRA
ncbi:MAG TPA: Sir2 family NAD-dependent protein deacetylase [Microbacterium sp.]|nr:Sir2 family NAD-dependent protein deacetylase [Microbacterium sp.]